MNFFLLLLGLSFFSDEDLDEKLEVAEALAEMERFDVKLIEKGIISED